MPHSRRPQYPNAVSSFTRAEKLDTNMHLPHEIVHMDEKYHRDTRKYNAWKRKTKKAAKEAAKKEGGTRRRHRRHRSTRRR